jgi:hypothetical protein
MDQALNRLRLAPGDRVVAADALAVLTRGVGALQRSLLESAPQSAELTEPQRRARRFARVRVAEMALFQAAQVQAGRAAHDLYGSLKSHIDEARQDFSREFLAERGRSEAAVVPDYLHEELVLRLAHNDLSMLGPDYPGPLA